MSWPGDQSAQAKQKKERDRLIAKGVKPAKASKMAKAKFPLPSNQAKKKNRQPRGGDGSGRQTGAFGESKRRWWW